MTSPRALSFGAVADGYARHRPGYPRAAIRWLLERAPGHRVVDLGAGTGKLSATLAEDHDAVIAIEPDPAMRAQLAVVVPNVDVRGGSAESIPLGDASVDAVLAAQAFHWFDLDRALPELARVLVPDGVVGVLWNLRDEAEPWVAELSRVLGEIGGDGSRVDADPETSGVMPLGRSPLFHSLEAATFLHAQPLTVDDLVGLIATRSQVVLLPPPDREALLGRVRALCHEHSDLAGRAHFEMPYRTHAFRVRRAAR